MEKLKDSFDLYDIDSDDGINIIELDIILRYLQKSPSTEQLKKLFNDIDSDNNGKISFPEFCVLMGVNSEKSLEEVDEFNHKLIVEKSFNLFDTNNNGIIGMDELNQLMEFLDRRHTKLELVRILGSVDKDNTGTINLLEFQDLLGKIATYHSEEQNILQQLFTQIDRDKDGLISINELYYEMTKGGENITPIQMKAVFNTVDVNKNSWVDFDEFIKITK